MSHKKFPLVSYVLLAEFDIDKGSTLRHSIPGPTGVSDSLLADWMLPAGAHLRQRDSSVFFIRSGDLEQKSKGPDMSKIEKKQREMEEFMRTFDLSAVCYRFSSGLGDWTSEGKHKISFVKDPANVDGYQMLLTEVDGPALVKTKVTRDMQFTSLQEKFCSMYPDDGEAIGVLFDSTRDMNNMSAALDRIYAHCDAIIKLREEVTQSLSQRERSVAVDGKHGNDEDTPLCCFNILRTKLDDSVKRGAVVKALCVCTHYRWYESFRSLMKQALDVYFDNSSEDVLKTLFESINNIDLSHMPVLSSRDKGVFCSTRRDPTLLFPHRAIQRLSRLLKTPDPEWEFRTRVKLNLADTAAMDLTIPLLLHSDEVYTASLWNLVDTFKDGLPFIFNAVLMEKRVLFLGHNQPAESVCKHVLSSVLLVCPPLVGVLQRCYPYANLTGLDFLQTKGYIAGVTNPIFEQKQEWWDVLCDVTTGVVSLSPKYMEEINADDPESKSLPLDNEHMSRVSTGIKRNLGEEWLRGVWSVYTQQIVDIAMGEDQYRSDEERQTVYTANSYRVARFKTTHSFQAYQAHVRTRAVQSPLGEQFHAIRRSLRSLEVRSLSDEELTKMFVMFLESLKTDDCVLEFLSLLSPQNGGLGPVAHCLFHASEHIRSMCCDVMDRLDSVESGHKAMSLLNYFILLAYTQIRTSRKPTTHRVPSTGSGSSSHRRSNSRNSSSFSSSLRKSTA